MRLTLTILFTSLLLATSCNGASKAASDCDAPKVGQVLAACDSAGSIVVSLGSRDGIRAGDTLIVLRNGKQVTQIVIHEARDSQAAGTAIGGSSTGIVVPGDTVIGR